MQSVVILELGNAGTRAGERLRDVGPAGTGRPYFEAVKYVRTANVMMKFTAASKGKPAAQYGLALASLGGLPNIQRRRSDIRTVAHGRVWELNI